MVDEKINTELFLSCDWGTTSFRLRLVEIPSLRILSETSSEEGISSVFKKWSEADMPAEDRLNFYRGFLQKNIEQLKAQYTKDINDIPVVLSGMASSSIGMTELDYKSLPFAADGSDLNVHVTKCSPDFPHPLIIISGVCSDDDVMRGEETQLVGCEFIESDEAQLFLHPGTHAKHVVVQDGKAVAFKTFMTGEMFSLLSTKSLLAVSVAPNDTFNDAEIVESFRAGVTKALSGNFLHEIFLTRTNDLFKKITKKQNYFYLSGIVIGSELKSLEAVNHIYLSGEKRLTDLYLEALSMIGKGKKDITLMSDDDVILKGQFKILKLHYGK